MRQSEDRRAVDAPRRIHVLRGITQEDPPAWLHSAIIRRIAAAIEGWHGRGVVCDGGLGYLTYDLALAKLRDDPRYAAFVRKMKLAAN
jgi:hypothetical protein